MRLGGMVRFDIQILFTDLADLGRSVLGLEHVRYIQVLFVEGGKFNHSSHRSALVFIELNKRINELHENVRMTGTSLTIYEINSWLAVDPSN